MAHFLNEKGSMNRISPSSENIPSNAPPGLVDLPALETYLGRLGFEGPQILSLTPLGKPVDQPEKRCGYGSPLRIHFRHQDGNETFVIRTVQPNAFGHDRRSDRVEALVLAYDTFNELPRHVRAKDMGLFDRAGQLISLPDGEPFLVTNHVEGDLYADDLRRLSGSTRAKQPDLDRADALARYLARLHQKTRPSDQYIRFLRDTVGHGEGVFGLCDNYPKDCPHVSWERLEAIEHQLVVWRWKLRSQPHRCRRIHGDFHPFNILFRAHTDFSVLDASRGCAGDPADDVTCLSINYLFFALLGQNTFSGALRQVWDLFWATYLEVSEDRDLLKVVAPFFAWRSLVLASPIWYPDVTRTLRNRLLSFAERLLEGTEFHPAQVNGLL